MGALDKMWESRESNDGNSNHPTFVSYSRPSAPTPPPRPAPKPAPRPKTKKKEG